MLAERKMFLSLCSNNKCDTFSSTARLFVIRQEMGAMNGTNEAQHRIRGEIGVASIFNYVPND